MVRFTSVGYGFAFGTGMDNGSQSTTPAFSARTLVSLSHPTERALSRFAAHEMGPQSKKKLVQHLEICEDCRKEVGRLREISRRFRDLERLAIAQAGC
jgi:hypothetical protein